MQSYSKPSVTDLGTLRQLTQVGTTPDCDLGSYTGPGAGQYFCPRSS